MTIAGTDAAGIGGGVGGVTAAMIRNESKQTAASGGVSRYAGWVR